MVYTRGSGPQKGAFPGGGLVPKSPETGAHFQEETEY